MTTYFIFAGEASGDLHGSHLMQALKNENPSAQFIGVGGPQMRAQQLECFQLTENYQVMGFSDVLKALPRLWSSFWQVHRKILDLQPEAVILIDYPGFNLRLAKALRKKGYRGKIIQYICPSVWAHGKKRIQTLATHFDLLLTILPFESDYFAQTSLPVTYVGHPLTEQIRCYPYEEKWWIKCGLSSCDHLIALFPGSRVGEIQRHTATQLQVAQQLRQKDPTLQFALSCAHSHLEPVLIKHVKSSGLRLNQEIFMIPACYTQELMRDCYLALAKSGTVTLQLALHKIPTVVHYELSFLNELIVRYILRLKLPHYCLVNILGKKEIFPEKMGRGIQVETISTSLFQLHCNRIQQQIIKQECQQIVELLGHDPVSKQAAQAIIVV